MTDFDALRWGDTFNVPIPVSTGFVFRSKVNSQHQLCKCKWRWPLSWQVLTASQITPGLGETADFSVIYQLTVGVGGSQTTIFRPLLFTAANRYEPLHDLFQLPAQDIQVNAVVVSTGVMTGTSEGSCLISTFIAPVTEPHAMTELLRALKGEDSPQRWIESGPHQGFHEAPLHYKK